MKKLIALNDFSALLRKSKTGVTGIETLLRLFRKNV